MERKLTKHRKEVWVETEYGLVPSAEAVEKLMEIFKPSPVEIAIHKNAINRRVAEGTLTKGKDGNYYQTEKTNLFFNKCK